MDEAADHLKTKRPTVSRYETGAVLPVWSTVHMLLAFYKALRDSKNPDGPILRADLRGLLTAVQEDWLNN